MYSMLILSPIIVVVIVGSEDMISPFRLQVMDRGASPLDTRHVSWADFPSLTTLKPKENGTSSGGSAKVKYFQ